MQLEIILTFCIMKHNRTMAFQRSINVFLNVSFKEVFLYRVLMYFEKNNFNYYVKFSQILKSTKCKSKYCIYLKIIKIMLYNLSNQRSIILSYSNGSSFALKIQRVFFFPFSCHLHQQEIRVVHAGQALCCGGGERGGAGWPLVPCAGVGAAMRFCATHRARARRCLAGARLCAGAVPGARLQV